MQDAPRNVLFRWSCLFLPDSLHQSKHLQWTSEPMASALLQSILPYQPIDLGITAIAHTVRPFERVVLSVFIPLLVVTGVAKPLFNGAALKAARLRRPCARLRANRRDAMAVMLDVVTVNWG
jgi:hypothetical protein